MSESKSTQNNQTQLAPIVTQTIQIDDVPLLDFLGIQNTHLRELSAAFPNTKITSRGENIIIQGKEKDNIQVVEIIERLRQHYHAYGELHLKIIQDYIQSESESQPIEKDVVLYGVKGHPIKPKSANQAKLIQAVESHDLVFALGPAGTGKTYMSVALAVKALKNKEVKKIIFTRPAVEAGESLGFLPGDLKEKIDPYIRPIYDALEDMIPSEKLKFYQESGVIEIAPLAFMRGRTLSNAFILLDEAQNTTPMQLKMFLTRMGKHSKMIITGDKTQIDLPSKQKSGLIESLEVLKKVKGVAFIELHSQDVTRHPLVKDIITAYEKHQSDQDIK